MTEPQADKGNNAQTHTRDWRQRCQHPTKLSEEELEIQATILIVTGIIVKK